MAKGAAWMVLFKILERVIGLCGMIVLARLLIPADFGLVALATAVIAVLELLGAFSFDTALIQRADADRTYYDTAWSFNVIIGAAASLLVLTLAVPAANFYSDSRLAGVMFALTPAPLLSALENIGVVVYRKNMEFQKDFAFLITKKLLSVTVTLFAAITLKNYWALVVGILTGRVAGTGVSYLINSYRPQFSLQRRKELMHFSSWLLINNISSFVSNRVANFIIGKTAGATSLGVYSIASEISTLPTTELVAPINRAVFPAYAQMNHNQAELQVGYLRVAGMIAFMTAPAALGIAATAQTFIPLILGQKWMAAVPLVQVLAYFGLIQALQNNVGSVYYAMGKPKINTYISLTYNAMMVPLLVILSMKWSNLGACYALLIASAVSAPINFHVVLTMLKLRVSDFIAATWRSMVSGFAMFAGVTFVQTELLRLARPPSLSVTLAILVSAGAFIYVASTIVLWTLSGNPQGAESAVMTYMRKKLLPA